MTNEVRQNKTTGEWVIFAPSRRQRPQDFLEEETTEMSRPAYDETCPFCAGNEEMLTQIVMEMPGPKRETWQTRAVPNKFPALTPDGHTGRERRGIYLAMPGYGHHEVIIESPRHNQTIVDTSAAEMEVIVESYHRRYVSLMAEHENMMGILFRNHGPGSGASLIHPHSQLVVTGVVPRHVRQREDAAERYFDRWGRCVFCDILDFEQKEGRRVIAGNDAFLAFVPFAAEVPFEVWIMPRRHRADFGSIDDGEKGAFAAILRQVLSTLYTRLNDPDYNYVINTAAQYRAREPHLHWFLRIRTRLVTRAGFEIGSGMTINPSLPESDADFLNGKDD